MRIVVGGGDAVTCSGGQLPTRCASMLISVTVTWQSMHVEDPAVANWPELQFAQAVNPVDLACVPGSQRVH